MSMKKIFTPLFIVGLIIEISAFLISQTNNIPFVLNMLSPKYITATKGLIQLESKKLLAPEDTGFNEVENIFISLARAQNPAEKIKSISAIQFYRKAAPTFKKYSAKVNFPLIVKLSNGQEIEWEFNELKELIEELKIKHIFLYSFIIFLLGIAFQVIDKIRESKKDIIKKD